MVYSKPAGQWQARQQEQEGGQDPRIQAAAGSKEPRRPNEKACRSRSTSRVRHLFIYIFFLFFFSLRNSRTLLGSSIQRSPPPPPPPHPHKCPLSREVVVCCPMYADCMLTTPCDSSPVTISMSYKMHFLNEGWLSLVSAVLPPTLPSLFNG